MNGLRQLLRNELNWMDEPGALELCAVTLTREQIATLVRMVEASEAAAALPKIEPRMLHPQEPRGTKRSPEEVAQRLAELYGQSEELRGKFLRTCA